MPSLARDHRDNADANLRCLIALDRHLHASPVFGELLRAGMQRASGLVDGNSCRARAGSVRRVAAVGGRDRLLSGAGRRVAHVAGGARRTGADGVARQCSPPGPRPLAPHKRVPESEKTTRPVGLSRGHVSFFGTSGLLAGLEQIINRSADPDGSG